MLPRFDLTEYRRFLERLQSAGYHFEPVARMPDTLEQPTVYLRHDVDLFLAALQPMAELEAQLRMKATYFVLLTGPYNLLASSSRRILDRVRDLGHEIGLHYDLSTYPSDQPGPQLEHELSILERLVGQEVRSICMHQPFLGQSDPFRQHERLINPHDPRLQADLLYVSDSCRAWRDDTLLSMLGPGPPRRLLWTVHPELWLEGSVTDRIFYLEEILVARAVAPVRDYLLEEVREIWRTHPAPAAHDEREAQARA